MLLHPRAGHFATEQICMALLRTKRCLIGAAVHHAAEAAQQCYVSTHAQWTYAQCTQSTLSGSGG
jgi:hypothetical protein